MERRPIASYGHGGQPLHTWLLMIPLVLSDHPNISNWNVNHFQNHDHFFYSHFYSHFSSQSSQTTKHSQRTFSFSLFLFSLRFSSTHPFNASPVALGEVEGTYCPNTTSSNCTALVALSTWTWRRIQSKRTNKNHQTNDLHISDVFCIQTDRLIHSH